MAIKSTSLLVCLQSVLKFLINKKCIVGTCPTGNKSKKPVVILDAVHCGRIGCLESV